ncbi:MAG: HAMP domain-containing histidine kinase [Clostridiales bacterium]|nr:HAMP domain-containing histidine kinase [Clostridiales bacterium]
MPKKIFNRLSVKVFLITFLMQVAAGILICLTLYYFTPKTYLSSSDENYLKVFKLADQLRSVPEEQSGKIIDDFIRDNGISIALYNADESTDDKKVFAKTNSKLSLKTEEEVLEHSQAVKDKKDKGSFYLWFYNKDSYMQGQDNTLYELAYFFDNTKENVIPRSVKKSLPIMAGVITAISLLCSYIYTKLFAKPVNKISEVSQSMAQMDFSKKCESNRQDEIGDLARNLDAMAASLQEKMQSLERKNQLLSDEVTKRKELESQKDVFFSAASHELKTPVTVLEGQIRGMIDGIEPYSDYDEYLPKALGTVKRMENLINDILTASRMQSGKEIVSSKTDMVQLLEEKMEECEDLFSVRGIKMELSFENDLIFIGNKDLTSMAIGAFISNAAFYSSEGEKVFVDAEKITSDDDKEMVQVEIRNKGHIDEEDLPHLFEAFYRADKSRSRRSGGSGLGLYLAKLLVEKQGGSCDMDNSGEDVLATILLPADTAGSEGSEK